MTQPSKDSDEVYTLSKLFSCDGIELSAWAQDKKGRLLVVYVQGGDFIYYHFTEEEPIIKQIPWFNDPLHSPVSIVFSPSGIFLLVLSRSCNLYILPALPIIDSTCRHDSYFDTSDLTIHVYPFSTKVSKNKGKTKSPNSSLSVVSSLSVQSSSSNSSLNEKPRSCNSSSSSCSDSQGNENVIKLKEILSTKCEVCPSVVCWWQSNYNSLEVGIIGTKSGNIIFVDLITGLKIGETCVKGEIKGLSICQDNNYENVFLLIRVENNEQYKLILEQRHINYVWSGKQNSNGNEESDTIDSTNTNGNGNYLPSARARLQGLKQMSAEKLASLKNRIAETRSKMGVKQVSNEDSSGKFCGPPPENLGSVIGDTMISSQFSHDKNVLVGYYAQSQILTVHSMNLNVVPLFIHKMPMETEEVLLCDRIFYVISNHRTTLQVISSKLTETKIDQSNEFNTESILGEWDFKKLNEGNETVQKIPKDNKNMLAKPDLIPDDLPDDNEEIILNVYKIQGKVEDYNIAKVFKLEKTEEELPDVPKTENCVVVTNKNVYIVELKNNMVKVALEFILETHELEKAERICAIFGVNLQKLLELAGDIKLATLEFPTAIALYKLSKCGLLKSIVKLACGNHCTQVLNYSTLLLANSISDMSYTERVHLSNLLLMAYAQDILRNENNRKLIEKFSEFLETNPYFDEVLAISVTGQSLLFSCLHKLITRRGLILDGYTVLVKLMERFLNSKVLEWCLNKKDFWQCITNANLIEAMVIKSSSFPIFFDYITHHLDELDLIYLNRLLKVLDPTSPLIRPVAHVFKKEDSFDNDDTQTVFPFGKLVELFLITLLVKLNKSRDGKEGYRNEFLLPSPGVDVEDNSLVSNEIENFGSKENLGDEIWPIRKDILGNQKFPTKVNNFLSCGYGHVALIRNGCVYTWGQTARGCLGHGPSMTRYAAPSPITWLSYLKLEVSVVSCGKYHTAALTNNGVYTWGCSKYGQLGLGKILASPHPRLVNSLENKKVVTVVCGQYHTLALTNQGSVYAWGWGVHGQLGLGKINDQRYPKYVHTLKEHFIVDVAAGHGHSLFLSDKGHVYATGSSVFGQLGVGNATKNSVPVLVKGINGKVVSIATGYFHNLALTESNVLYTWGSSPQCLRFQAQARKRSRLLQSQKTTNTSDGDSSQSTTEESQEQVIEGNGVLDKPESEVHLSASVVDTKNVTGKIIQISCGCHHSALVTDSGELYTWGRSIDGQLGNGGHREIQIPTQISSNGFKVDCVSCGCEFTAAQEKHTGKVYCWGSNSVGQLAIPKKESSTKMLDGKLVMLKTCKKIVRLLDRNAGSNTVDTPKEVTEIPPPSFTYQTLSKHMTSSIPTLSAIDPEYSDQSLHFIIEKFSHCINLTYIFKKSLEYNNYQAASKISLLQYKYKLSLIYQLKALQNLPIYHSKPASYLQKLIEKKEEKEKAKAKSEKEEPEIHLFTVEGGHEDMCDELRNKEDSSLEDDDPDSTVNEKENFEILQPVKEEYIRHAKYILDAYIKINSSSISEGFDKCSILETGIQFWTAEKLPIPSLEDFILERLDDIFYEFGCLLFCHVKENEDSVLQSFSTSFLLVITSKILSRVDKNESCVEYLEALSKLLTNDSTYVKSTLIKKKRFTKKNKPKSESYIETIGENLKQQWPNENYVKISSLDVIKECTYFFSCGHSHSYASFEEDCKVLKEMDSKELTSKLMSFYEALDNKNLNELACPSCVRNYIRQ